MCLLCGKFLSRTSQDTGDLGVVLTRFQDGSHGGTLELRSSDMVDRHRLTDRMERLKNPPLNPVSPLRHFTPVTTKAKECTTKFSRFHFYTFVAPTACKFMIESCLGMIKRLATHAPVWPEIHPTRTTDYVVRKLMLCPEEFDLRETSDRQDDDVARSYLSSRVCWIGSTAQRVPPETGIFRFTERFDGLCEGGWSRQVEDLDFL
jgi:hypothetical protein